MDRRTLFAAAGAFALPLPAVAQRALPSPNDLAVPAGGINEALYIAIGGMDQWVTIRGQNRANPFLLILPGGPGGFKSDIPHHFRPYERSFTVVHWDQPGTGKTYAKAKAFGPEITLDKIVADGIELAGVLRQRFGAQKIVLLGESFGSMIGLKMAKAKPSAFAGYVGVGQLVSWEKRAVYARDMCLRIADELGDAQSLAQLKAMTPPYWRDPGPRNDLDRISRNYIRGNRLPPLWSIIGNAQPAGFTLAERGAAQEGGAKSSERFLPEVYRFDAETLGARFDMPMAVINGEHDHHTPTAVARKWHASITAPQKAFVTIPDGRHTILTSHPMETLRALEKTLRPWGLAGGAVDPAAFDRLAGRYQVAPGVALTVARRESSLFMAALGQNLELRPETASTYYLPEFDANIAFDIGSDGPAQSMTLQAGDLILKGPRAA